VSEMPTGWVQVPLGQVATSQLGRMLSARRETCDHAKPYLRNRDVQWGHINVDELPVMDFGPSDTLRFLLRPGDVLVCEGGEVGRAAIWHGQLSECYYQKALHRVHTSAALLPEFLLYLLEHYARTRAFERYTSGSTIAHLPQEDLRNLPIPIPPAAEQERIVAAIEEQFSRLDAGVAALDRVGRNLKRMRSAVLKAAVSGVLVNAGADEWTSITLGELLEDMHAGKSFKCAERPARPDEWGVVKVSAMTWGEFRESENKTVQSDRNIDPRFEIHPGDLLVSRANTVDYVGAVVLVRDCRSRLLLSDKSLRLVPTSRVMPEWLVISLRASSARRYIESAATGTSDSMRNISQPKLRALSIKLPPLEVQAELVSEVGRMMSLIEQLERSLADNYRSTHALRTSILGAAFSGRLAAQDTSDEPVSALLARVAAENASVNGQKSTRIGKSRTPREKVVV
jgi:type I restriction enzyme, S subunit